MKRFYSTLLILAAFIFSGNTAFGQRAVGGSSVDLDDNTGNHVFITTTGHSLGVNATGLLPNTGALLDLNSTTKGLLVPRMNAAQEAGVATIAGMVVYNTTSQSLDIYNGAAWASIGGGWSLTGNSGTNPAVNYLGTNDGQDLVIRTSGSERLRILSGGNMNVSSTAGTAITISGPAATSISANGLIVTGGNVSVAGTSTLGSTSTPIKGIYKLTVGATGFVMPANTGGSQSFISFFSGSGFSPVPGVGDAIIVNADPGVFPVGITWSATFTGSDAFQINIVNGTGAPVTIGLGNFYVTAIKY